MTRRNFYASALVAAVFVCLCSLPLTAQDDASATTVREATGFAVSPPLRELAKLPRPPQYSLHESHPVLRIPKRDFGVAVDPVEQGTPPPAANYSIGLDFLGVGNGFPGFSVTDPDPETNMAVGDTQIVQWANGSFAVFNKFTNAILAGPIAGNLLFSAIGGACAANDDVEFIAQWDNAAHRWFLAQTTLSGPQYYACIAVSTSADALGTYYLYPFPLGNGFPDYQKWGRWNNNWAQTMNNYGPGGSGFVGAEVCVYNRTALLNNQGPPPPVQVCHQYSSNDDSLLPADIDSSNSPPAAESQFFIGSVDEVDNSHLSLYSVTINWLHPSLAVFTGNNNSQLIAVPTYTGSCNGVFGVIDCVPQKGVSDKLESLGDRLMYRFAYDNDPVGGVQHWYVNHDVEASGGQIGVRWYEFQAPQISIQPPGLTLFQSGTYAPDSNYRWMGSIAADSQNDILVGYSISSSSLDPSINIAGRLKTDSPGTLEAEVPVVAGTGSQTDTSGRWGTFSAMRLDPDGCTFWYTTEYYMLTASFDWSTQIASARFATCQNPAYDGYLEICKQTDPDYPVSGPFSFMVTAPFFSTGPIVVPVGACSPPTQVPSGIVTINEAPQVGVAVENVTAYSYDQYGNYINELDSWTPPQQTATVTVVPGGVSLETVATYTNYAPPLQELKICKIAGSGVAVGTLFNFTATDGTTYHTDQVQAGPPPGGYCVVDGTWPINDPVTITEVSIPSGVSVSGITFNQGPVGPCNPPATYCGVATIGSGLNEVSFTDVVALPQGSCQPSESLSVMVLPTGNGCNLSGGCVVAWVPEGDWLDAYAAPGVVAANVEGSYIVGSPQLINTGSDIINSCASDPLLGPQTVCTASSYYAPSNNVYVIAGNNPPAVVYTVQSAATPTQTLGRGQIQFSGGTCNNCGVAMDAVHAKAMIGLSIPPLDSGGYGKPGFQFLDLTNLSTAPSFEPAWKSPAGQISEDILIDPIGDLLLSPAEGHYCYGIPPIQCVPNYEIATVTYPVGGNSQLTFYENNLTQYSTWPTGGWPDSAGEDCNAKIALAEIESLPNLSTPFVADLTQVNYTSPPLWSDPASGFYPVPGSYLNGNLVSPSAETGPIAVAQGTSHEGVLGQEVFYYSANTITAFRLSVPYNASAPFQDWVTCDLGDISSGVPFAQGADPHTVTAYQSPNPDPVDGTFHSFAVFANSAPASTIAVVDLDRMLNQSSSGYVFRFPGTHVCNNPPTMKYWNAPVQSIGTLPATVVRFIAL